MHELNQNQLADAIAHILRYDLVGFISGSPGIGKSDIVKQVARRFNLKVIDVRLAQSDPTDLQGMPNINGEKVRFVPPAQFPLEDDEIPEGYEGWLVFLDELNSAPPAVQSASYKVLLDRMIDMKKLHPRVRLIGAGNKETDRAITTRQGTANQSRLIHLSLRADPDAWLDWANLNGIDHRIISFIKFRSNLLHKFDPNHDDHTFPCPRTWFFLSKLIKDVHEKDFDVVMSAIMAGTVGVGASTEFKAFTQIYNELPTIEEIIESPTTWNVPKEPSKQYAITTLISHNAEEDTIEPLIKAIQRLPKEMALLTMREIHQTKEHLKRHPLVRDWIIENAYAMF